MDSLDYVSFCKDTKIQDAVIRNLEVLGEAAKKIPPKICEQCPDLPFQEMSKTRDRFFHHYFGVNLDVVWGIIELELPELEDGSDAIINKL